jgi:hypothetical protein
MSTHVVGIRPPDDRWRKMKAIWDACDAAGIAPPSDVDRFFEYDKPDPMGVVIELDKHKCVAEYKDDARLGYDINLAALPPDVTVVRVYNAW